MTEKKNYRVDSETFMNPYTFIPLGKKCNKLNIEQSKLNDEKLTGFIECKLTTLTPIFIPDHSNINIKKMKILDSNNEEKEIEIQELDFFSYNKKETLKHEPVLPGSEIRGVIRSIYETLTNSCLSVIESSPITGRFWKKMSPGLLSYDSNKQQWMFKYAYRNSFTPKYREEFNSDLFNFGEIVKYKKKIKQNKNRKIHYISKVEKSENPGGYLFIGNEFEGEKKYSVFVEKRKKNSEKIEKSSIKNLKNSLSVYHKNGFHKKIRYEIFNDIKEKGIQLPVFYFCCNEKKNSYLDFSCIGRIGFYSCVNDRINDYSPCFSKEELCPACNLFGFIKKNTSVASKVRFTDAKVMNINKSKCFLKSGLIPELSSPKIQCWEFYFEKPNDARIWNIDFYQNTDMHYRKYDKNIRGRKFYWHSHFDENSYSQIEEESISDRQKIIHPVNKDINFQFKVFFDRITKDQFHELIYILNLTESGNYGFKIGMGKPLGLGSVKIKIEKVYTRTLNLNSNNLNYSIKENAIPKVDPSNNFDEINLELLLKVLKIQKENLNIHYPINSNETEIFRWFEVNKNANIKLNKSVHIANAFKPYVFQVLPKLSNDKQFLKQYRLISMKEK